MAQPTIIISFTPESVLGAGDGTATATPSGGYTPYSYLWDTGETTQTVTDLKTGWHWVMVTSGTGVDEYQPVIGFIKIPLQDQQYDFNMTDSQLECFLQVASCKFGDEAHKVFEKNSMGIRDWCCDKKLFLLMKNIETAACWHPQELTDVEEPAYFSMYFNSYTQGANDALQITILGQTIEFEFLAADDLGTNLTGLVNLINQDPILKAQVDGNRLWIYAPSGYSGVPVTVAQSVVDISYDVLTPTFQGGRQGCGSYVSWNGVLFLAPQDCLSEDQIANILDNIKNFVNCDCSSPSEIINDCVN